MSKNRKLMLGLLSIAVASIFLTGVWFHMSDPLVNFYGIKMRQSTLHAFMQETRGTAGIYCVQNGPIDLEDTMTCFDSELEFDQFIAKRGEITQLIR